MDISKMVTDIAVFIEQFNAKASSLEQLLLKLKTSTNILAEQLSTISIITEVQLPTEVLEKHPCIVKRVSNCLRNLVEDEINEIDRSLSPLKEMITNFGRMYRKIEFDMMKIKWSEVSAFISPVFVHVTEWVEKCWKYFQLVHLNINNAVQMVHHDITQSNKWVKDVFKFDDEERIQIFNHPAIDMFLLLNKGTLTNEKT